MHGSLPTSSYPCTHPPTHTSIQSVHPYILFLQRLGCPAKKVQNHQRSTCSSCLHNHPYIQPWSSIPDAWVHEPWINWKYYEHNLECIKVNMHYRLTIFIFIDIHKRPHRTDMHMQFLNRAIVHLHHMSVCPCQREQGREVEATDLNMLGIGLWVFWQWPSVPKASTLGATTTVIINTRSNSIQNIRKLQLPTLAGSDYSTRNFLSFHALPLSFSG